MKIRHRLAIATLLTLSCISARAQGIPVIDVANLIQTIQQVANDITKINNQVQQISQLQAELNSISGLRNLGNVFNSPQLRNYVPASAFTVLDAVHASGYAGLSTSAKTLRDAGWSTTAWTSTAQHAPAARRHSPSRTSTRACCKTR